MSKGIKGGRSITPIPFGTVIFTLAIPAPVTVTHPNPVNVMSAAASLQPVPSISIICDSNSPSCSIRSGASGGINILPTCSFRISSTLSAFVGWSLISLATKKVKKNGLLGSSSSTLARPPTSTVFPALMWKVIGSTCLMMKTRETLENKPNRIPPTGLGDHNS